MRSTSRVFLLTKGLLLIGFCLLLVDPASHQFTLC